MADLAPPKPDTPLLGPGGAIVSGGRDDWRQDRIGAALRGANPTVLRRLPGGFAVIGDVQFLPGYCVLLCDSPGVERLSDLPRAGRLAFLESMDRLGTAVERACADHDHGFRRVNLEILGNTDPYLHAHVWPRYSWEPAEHLGAPVWSYPRERWHDPITLLGPAHAALRAAITGYLDDSRDDSRDDSGDESAAAGLPFS